MELNCRFDTASPSIDLSCIKKSPRSSPVPVSGFMIVGGFLYCCVCACVCVCRGDVGLVIFCSECDFDAAEARIWEVKEGCDTCASFPPLKA